MDSRCSSPQFQRSGATSTPLPPDYLASHWPGSLSYLREATHRPEALPIGLRRETGETVSQCRRPAAQVPAMPVAPAGHLRSRQHANPPESRICLFGRKSANSSPPSQRQSRLSAPRVFLPSSRCPTRSSRYGAPSALPRSCALTQGAINHGTAPARTQRPNRPAPTRAPPTVPR